VSLFKGAQFAGALYSGALWGGQDEIHPVPLPPVSYGGGRGFTMNFKKRPDIEKAQVKIRISRMVRDQRDIKEIIATVKIVIGLIE